MEFLPVHNMTCDKPCCSCVHNYNAISDCSADRGKDTREYNTLLDNLTSITNSLTTVTGSKDELRLKFAQKRWLDITASPSENELVILVLGRVAEDSRTFYEFVMLLSEIGGMDLAAKALTTTLQEYGELP